MANTVEAALCELSDSALLSRFVRAMDARKQYVAHAAAFDTADSLAEAFRQEILRRMAR